MKIAQLFEVTVEEKIEPVIKVAEWGNEAKLASEIAGYVVTPLIERVLEEFLEHYTDTFRSDTSEVGVWISGYFGSGKSHLAKIMALLAQNRLIDGISACERFEARIPQSSSRHDSILRSLRRMPQCRTEVLAFNLNTKKDANTPDLARFLLSQFYLERGYCGNLTFARVIEAEIDRLGRLDALHQEIERLTGKSWEQIRYNPSFFYARFLEAAHLVAPEAFGSAADVKEILVRAEQEEIVNVSFLVRECLTYLDHRAKAEPGVAHRLLWVLDETGQWIKDDKDRLSALQAFIEELDLAGKGRIMAIVATHGDMGSVYAGAHALDTEMKKIAGRFWSQPALTTENIEIVLEERLLKKTHEGEEVLRGLYERRGGTLRTIGELEDSNQKLPDCSESGFIKYYPFLPYQVHLIPEIVKSLRSKGGQGEQMSGSTRTLLGIVQDILRSGRRSFLDAEPGPLVSFDEFYFNLEGAEISPDVRMDISRIVEKTEGTTETRQVAEVLYLIRELPFIPRTLENLTRLQIQDVDDEQTAVRSHVEAELGRLMRAKLVSRSGEEYEYLTGERRTFEDAVATVEQQYEAPDLERGLFDHFVRGDGRDHFSEWLGAATLEYLQRQFPIALAVDGRPVPGTSGGVTLDLTTPYGRLRYDEQDLLDESLKNPRTFFVVAGKVPDLERDLARYLAMREVADRWKSDPHRSEEARALARERQETDLVQLRRAVVAGLTKGLASAALIFRGALTPVPQRNGETASAALHGMLGGRLGEIYTKFARVSYRIKDDDRAIREVLAGKGAKNADAQALQLYDSASGTLNEHAPVIDGVIMHLRAMEEQGRRTTGKELLSLFEEPEYGWDQNAVRVAVAALVREGRAELSLSHRPVRNPGDPELVDALRIRNKFQSAEVVPVGAIEPADLTTARTVLIGLTGKHGIDETAPALAAAFADLAEEVGARATPVRTWAAGAGLSLPAAFTDGQAAYADVLAFVAPGLRVAAILSEQERLKTGHRAISSLAAFQKEHGPTFVALRDYVGQLAAIEPFAADQSAITECIKRFRAAARDGTVADPAVWKAVLGAKANAVLAEKELAAGWRTEAHAAVAAAATAVQQRGEALELDGPFTDGLLSELATVTASIDTEPSTVKLAALPAQVRRLERQLLDRAEAEAGRRRPVEPKPKPAPKVEHLKFATVVGRRRIRTVAEWTAVAAALDSRMKALLEGGAEVELE